MKLIFANDKETRTEAYMSSKLKHTNIIDFYGYSTIEKGESSLMLLDFAKFGSLRSFQRKTIKRMTFSESMICFFVSQILKGIVYCHQSKIAHLDIKPQNIVVDEFLNAKLIDFSISLNYKNHRPEEELKVPFRGTNFYMSKEVINSERIKYKDLNKIDMYALGVLMYNLAYAKYPYDLTHGDEEDYSKIYQKITNNPLTFPNDSEYSAHFKDFVSKLLEKDINKRMDMYESLNHYWINGAKILYDEREKCYNAGVFVSYLLTDHIRDFNEYMQKQD
jgi:serine/threonine protein kinase